MKKLTLAAIFLLLSSLTANATSLIGRLGIGMSNNLPSGMETLSLKLQSNSSTSVGGHFGMDNSPDGSLYAIGVKIYRIIYDEPQLNFYSSGDATIFTYFDSSKDVKQGNKISANFGTEFMFQGIESVGFSFEFGLGVQNYQDQTHIKTMGHNIIQSAVHFYL
jgi:hypothetical protein